MVLFLLKEEIEQKAKENILIKISNLPHLPIHFLQKMNLLLIAQSLIVMLFLSIF